MHAHLLQAEGTFHNSCGLQEKIAEIFVTLHCLPLRLAHHLHLACGTSEREVVCADLHTQLKEACPSACDHRGSVKEMHAHAHVYMHTCVRDNLKLTGFCSAPVVEAERDVYSV